MKSRPRLLYLMAAINLLLIIGFPLQVFLINEHEWKELIPVFSELTILNWAVMGALGAQIPLVLRASRLLRYTAPLTIALVAFNNWIVSYVGFDFSMAETTFATATFAAAQSLWLHPTMRALFRNPENRWWMIRTRDQIQIPVQMWTLGGMPIVTSAFDISPGGIFVHFSIESLKQCGLKIGDPIRLRMRLGSVYRLTAQAKVVRFAKASGAYPEGMGLKFVAMSRQDQNYPGEILGEKPNGITKNGGMKIQFEPIGYIKSCYKQKFGTPRQSGLASNAWASLTLEKRWHNQGLFDGLENFSHVWLIGFFHENENKSLKGKIRPPKLIGKKLGVLASRSPHRPNAISLTVARIDSIEGNTLILKGIDLIEDTPILDIKPYVPRYDRINEAQSTLVTDPDIFEVKFSELFLEELHAFKLPLPENEFLSLVQETLRLDPRPNVYKKLGPEFAFTLFDWDIGFRYVDKTIIVETLQPAGCLRTQKPKRELGRLDQSKAP